MMWIFVIILIVLVLIFGFNKDYKENVKTNVTLKGGMQTKYNLLLEYLTSEPSSRMTKLTHDRVVISSPNYVFNIDYVGSNTEISLKATLPLIGNFSNKWQYVDGYPQEKMIEEIENFLDWKITELKNIAKNDTMKYINYKD